MKETSWKWTLFSSLHEDLKPSIKLEDGELVIISFYRNSNSWTVYTSRRIIAHRGEKRAMLRTTEVFSFSTGNFKGSNLEIPTVEVGTYKYSEESAKFDYETGYASMAIIYYDSFWHRWNKVWKRTYELEHQKA